MASTRHLRGVLSLRTPWMSRSDLYFFDDALVEMRAPRFPFLVSMLFTPWLARGVQGLLSDWSFKGRRSVVDKLGRGVTSTEMAAAVRRTRRIAPGDVRSVVLGFEAMAAEGKDTLVIETTAGKKLKWLVDDFDRQGLATRLEHLFGEGVNDTGELIVGIGWLFFLPVGGALFGIALAALNVLLLLWPATLGTESQDRGTRVFLSVTGGLLLGLGLVVLPLGLSSLSSRASRILAGYRKRKIGSYGAIGIVSFTAGLSIAAILIPVLYSAAPAPTAAQIAADRARVEAQAAAAARTRNVHPMGATARDGSLGFSVQSISRVASFRQEYGRPFRPVAGDELLAVAVNVTNYGGSVEHPFIYPGYGILLVDSHGQRFRYPQATIDIRPESWPPSLAANSSASETLYFQVPRSTRLNGVLLWDVFESGDRAGASYVYVRTGRAPAYPRLGPTASAPSVDR